MNESYRSRLVSLLSEDLNFHSSSSTDYTHDLHAFPAKFPPQLPRKFIEGLTDPGDLVLDPMVGSGTTLVETLLAGRQAVGFDIDPLALRLCRVKTTPVDGLEVARVGQQILRRVRQTLYDAPDVLQLELDRRLDLESQEFVNYWFGQEAQAELLALLREIEMVEEVRIRALLELTFSAVIITKSGGVSLARDLAHTRPHKVEDKPYRSPIKEFEKRLKQNLNSVVSLPPAKFPPVLSCGNAQNLPLSASVVDLIVTSPPYPANAIDYMRAHKFSLVWFGYPVQTLSQYRKKYIGGETFNGTEPERLPSETMRLIDTVSEKDRSKAKSLLRYYSEMTRVLEEMFRVLKLGKAAVVVVGSSSIRGVDTRTHECLAEIGRQIGFEIPHIGVRSLDRDRRMLPVRRNRGQNSQIENRMHEEYVIGFYKPGGDE